MLDVKQSVFSLCFIIVVISVSGFAGATEGDILSGMDYDLSLDQSVQAISPYTVVDMDRNSRNSRVITCDEFSYPDGTTVDGWTEQAGDWTIAGSRLASPDLSGPNFITNDGSYINGDGCVTVDLDYGSGTNARNGAAMLWFQSTSSWLYFKVQDNSYCGYFDSIGLYQNGTGLFMMDLDFGVEPIIQLEVVGTDAFGRVDVDRDGVFDYEYTQTVAPSDGLSGIQHWNAQVLFDNHCYGDECGGPVVTPTPVATLTPTPLPTEIPTMTPTIIPCINDGDVNLDDTLTAGDAQLTFLIALGSMSPTFEEECAADCNGDGTVTAGDAQLVFLAALGSDSCVNPI